VKIQNPRTRISYYLLVNATSSEILETYCNPDAVYALGYLQKDEHKIKNNQKRRGKHHPQYCSPRHDNTERHFFIIKANREYRNAMPKRGRMKSAKVTKQTWTKEMITKLKELVLFQMVSRSRVLLDQLHRPESPPYFPAFRDSNPPSPLPRHSLERSIS